MAGSSQRPFYSHSGFCVFRTPLLPFDELIRWSADLQSTHIAGEENLEHAVASDCSRLRERLAAIVDRPEVREAVFVGSPSLHADIDRWRAKPESKHGRKIECSLVKYFSRMAGRATPFGLFAGCTLGKIGPESHFKLVDRDRYRRHTRLDMYYLTALCDDLTRDPGLRRALRFFPNSSLYSIPGRVRYQEYRGTTDGRTHRSVSVEDNEPLQIVLDRAKRGAMIEELCEALAEFDTESELEEREEYIFELIDSQVLASDFAAAVTGRGAIHDLIERLRATDQSDDIIDLLEAVRDELAAIDQNGVGNEIERYDSLSRRLSSLPVEIKPSRLFQVDMVKPAAEVTLGTSVIKEVRRGVELLQRLARPSGEDELSRFRSAFSERYQGQHGPPYEARYVPLVEVLDDELGIGFSTTSIQSLSALLEGIDVPTYVDSRVAWTARDRRLLLKLHAALRNCDVEIELDRDDIDAMANPEPPPLPDAFAALATVSAWSAEAVNRGEFQVAVSYASGPSGAVLLGRFCHADEELRQAVRSHLQAEEAHDPDAIFAEIVHVPEEGRIGNIVSRPVLREYEITYLGSSGAPIERQIPISDLHVTVAGDEIVLWSSRLSRRVIPRLTSAHNFRGRGKGIYRFLCLLQSLGTVVTAWTWGALSDAPFLPRVVHGRLVLSQARWLIDKSEIEPIAKGHGCERFHTFQMLRDRLRLPRWIAVADADNKLTVDLDNVLSIDAFVELIRNRARTELVEIFPQPDQLCVSGPEGRFVHEIVVPFVRRHEVASSSGNGSIKSRPNIAPQPNQVPRGRRSFPPGSEWLYAKFYSGVALADEILRDVVTPLTQFALETGVADRWFFIRYADPDFHLRVRYHGEPLRLAAEFIPAVHRFAEPFLQDGRIWKLQFDTYERETERYGGEAGVELAEALFQADSEFVLDVAPFLVEDFDGDLRWRLALRGMEMLLDDLGVEEKPRETMLERLRDGFAREFHADDAVRKQIGAKYHRERQAIEQLFSGGGSDERLGTCCQALQLRSARWAAAMSALKESAPRGQLSIPLEELASSFLHMQANRVLQTGQRLQEMVLYDFLHRKMKYVAEKADQSMSASIDVDAAKANEEGKYPRVPLQW